MKTDILMDEQMCKEGNTISCRACNMYYNGSGLPCKASTASKIAIDKWMKLVIQREFN